MDKAWMSRVISLPLVRFWFHGVTACQRRISCSFRCHPAIGFTISRLFFVDPTSAQSPAELGQLLVFITSFECYGRWCTKIRFYRTAVGNGKIDVDCSHAACRDESTAGQLETRFQTQIVMKYSCCGWFKNIHAFVQFSYSYRICFKFAFL